MKKTKVEIIKYEITNDFFVEVTENDKTVEFWLCAYDYGIKSLMFGLFKKDCKPEEYEEMILSNVKEYITSYIEDYF